MVDDYGLFILGRNINLMKDEDEIGGTVARLGFLGPLLGSGAPCSWPGG